MKNNIILRMSLLTVAVLFLTTCTKTYMEKAQDSYSASKVVPIILKLTGPTSVLQSFSFEYSVAGGVRAGSIIEWTVSDCVIESKSEDTHTITVKFSTLPAAGTKAKIQAVETTVGGQVSAAKEVLVTVSQFCPLAVSGFVGAWGGTDGFGTGSHLRASQVVLSAPSGTSMKVRGLNFGWMTDKWGETITAGGTINMTINPNGTIVIPDQYCFTTDYDGSPYEYWITGTGTWGNCGTKPEMKLNYIVYYKSDDSKLPVDYYTAYPTFVATLTLP